nr:hypothetical protein [Morchella crassipes]
MGGRRGPHGGGLAGPPHSVIIIFSLFLSLREREKKRIAPAEQPSCTRCVQPPPRCARGGAIPPPDFSPSPPPLPTVGSGGEWEGGVGGLRCRVEKNFVYNIKKLVSMQPPLKRTPPFIFCIPPPSGGEEQGRKIKGGGVQEQGRGAAACSCWS